jgi:hypothetical protein
VFDSLFEIAHTVSQSVQILFVGGMDCIVLTIHHRCLCSPFASRIMVVVFV